MSKVYKTSFLLFFVLIILTSCSFKSQTNEKQESNFSKENIGRIKDKSKKFSNEELQNGEVPLYEYIQLAGKIIISDSKDKSIEKGDRFILQQGEYKYQVINEQESVLNIGDQVTVYGEYYGFIKGSLIERSTKSD